MNTFDKWREGYDSMSFAEQVKYHNEIEHQYPEQAHYNYNNIKGILYRGATILEFGTWKADLAQIAIIEFGLKSWKGIEICSNAIALTRCNHQQFSYIQPKRFDWWLEELPYSDITIATHFIEHLSNKHFEQLVSALKSPLVYFEAPLTDGGEDWAGYIGTHKLEYGWDKVNVLMNGRGYFVKANYIEGKLYSL